MVVGFTCTLYPGLWPGQCSRPGQSCILAPWTWHSQKPRCLAAERGWGSVCRAVRPGSLSPAFSQIPTKPRKEHRNATQEVPSSQPPVPGLAGWGGNWPMGDHTQLPIHPNQRLYILNSCCLCLAFNSGCFDPAPRNQFAGDNCDTDVPVITDLQLLPTVPLPCT